MGMDVNLGPGRRANAVSGRVVRELEEADLSVLAVDRGTQAVPIKALRHRHHSLARALAAGMKDWEAALSCGYDPSRVSILKGDPTFRELVKFYEANVDAAYADLHQRLAGLSTTAADILQERLEEDPDELSVGQLKDLVQLGADRTGYGPQTTNTTTHLHVDISKRLEAARKRVDEHRTLDLLVNAPVGQE